jgi:hypothetical protein
MVRMRTAHIVKDAGFTAVEVVKADETLAILESLLRKRRSSFKHVGFRDVAQSAPPLSRPSRISGSAREPFASLHA